MKRTDRVELYQDDAGEWRWHRIAPNGEIIADSGEGYKDSHHARLMAERCNIDLLPLFREI